MPLHIKAEPGEVAESAIIVSDPEHSRLLSSILDSPKLVNENRGYLTYTGTYMGKRITIAAHGIGGPSASIVIEELAQLGVKRIIRIGTALSLYEELKPGEIVLPTAASYMPGGTLGEYVTAGYITLSATPSFELLLGFYKALEGAGLMPKIGPIFSNDLNYLGQGIIDELKLLKALAVDMEMATVFGLSLIRGLTAAGALIITGDIYAGPSLAEEKLRSLIQEVAKAAAKALTEKI